MAHHRRAAIHLYRGCCGAAWLATRAEQAVLSAPAAAAAAAQGLLWQPQHQQQQRWSLLSSSSFSTTTIAHASSTGSDDSSAAVTSTGADPVADHFERMLEVMLQNPTVMNMMLARMPPHMRRPEVLKAMMQDPAIRSRMSALAQEKGLASIIASVDMDKVSQGMSATLQAGIDPGALIERFQQSPSLAKAMENPRVLAALMDMASNGADALKKYEGDKDIVEAAMEAGDILQQLQQAGGGGCGSSAASSSSSSGDSSSSMSAVEQQLGVSPQDLMQRLMSRPDLLAKVQDPEVQAALMEVSQSPWKLVKYVFNKRS